MTVDKIQLSEKIKQCMKERGMSQAQLAEELEVTEAAVNNYVNCKAVPPTKTLAAMAWVFAVSADWLLGIDREDRKTIKLPYRITPKSVLYWNEHTEMPGIATFADPMGAEEFYQDKLKAPRRSE